MAAFPFHGHADETGTGAGANFNVNYPMPAGTPYSEWSKALDNALQRIRDFAPQGVVVSLGVDTFERDPISFSSLQALILLIWVVGFWPWFANSFVMEGGYAVEEIGVNTVNVLMGFEGKDHEPVDTCCSNADEMRLGC